MTIKIYDIKLRRTFEIDPRDINLSETGSSGRRSWTKKVRETFHGVDWYGHYIKLRNGSPTTMKAPYGFYHVTRETWKEAMKSRKTSGMRTNGETSIENYPKAGTNGNLVALLHLKPRFGKKRISERELPKGFHHFDVILQACDKDGKPIRNISLYRYKENEALASLIQVVK